MSYALADMSKFAIFSLGLLVVLADNAGAQEKGIGAACNGITPAAIRKRNLAATGGSEAFQRLQRMVVRGELGLYTQRSSASVNYFYEAHSSHVVQLRINR